MSGLWVDYEWCTTDAGRGYALLAVNELPTISGIMSESSQKHVGIDWGENLMMSSQGIFQKFYEWPKVFFLLIVKPRRR